MWEIVEHTLLDSLRMLPFLIVAYLFIEYISRGTGEKIREFITDPGILGPVAGGLLGLIPQCGISVMAANLYSERMITVGTLIAVFIATSDEAIPVLFANPGNGKLILQLLGVKIVLALVFGLFIDLVGRKKRPDKKKDRLVSDETCQHKECDITCKCGCHIHEQCHDNIVIAALLHTIRIYLFILIILFILNTGLFLMGENAVATLLMQGSIFQPFVTAIFGMVPSCASSVVLTQLYLENNLTFGSMVAGLSGGTGVGLAILIRSNRNRKETLMIVGGLYAIGVTTGLLLNFIL